MTAKFGQTRRDAFFAALRETGNRTLAAEAAKVSQSWVGLQRAKDPGFRRAMAAAVAEARARLAAHPERRPPAEWGFRDGEELVVRGSNGRRVQIARARPRQITPRVEARFLAALAATCNVKASCAAAQVSFGAMYGHRKRWPDFARRWQEALETGYRRIDAGILAHCIAAFQPRGIDPELPMPPMTIDDAIRLLRVYDRRAREAAQDRHWKMGLATLGRPPGRRQG